MGSEGGIAFNNKARKETDKEGECDKSESREKVGELHLREQGGQGGRQGGEGGGGRRDSRRGELPRGKAGRERSCKFYHQILTRMIFP